MQRDEEIRNALQGQNGLLLRNVRRPHRIQPVNAAMHRKAASALTG